MRRHVLWGALAAAITGGLGWSARPAAACGGCFAPGDTVTAVDAHRMVISLSAERTVLWDQIVYSGNPKDFVWVLPVPTPSATLEIADPQFFADLDALTAPQVNPQPPVFSSASGFGCGDAGDNAPPYIPPDDGVTIYDEQVVGPYQTVVIGSEDAGALQNWLVEHGYRVVESTVPTIDHYVELGSVFIVLRLAPGEGVQSMQPVRVSYPGYMASFPLEMVKVGAAGRLALLLWVISEQRYQAWNYANAVIDPAEVAYDWNTFTSNYEAIFTRTIEDTGGRTWVTEHAQPWSGFAQASGEDARIASRDIASPFVTRLRTSMLVDHLDEDLVLVPAEDPSWVSNQLVAGIELDRPFPYPGEEDDGCALGGDRRAGGYLFAVLLVVGLEHLGSRRRRHRRPA